VYGRGTPEYPGFVAVLIKSDHPDITGEPDMASSECIGMCYRIDRLSKILADLDYREKNGYTRTCVEVSEYRERESMKREQMNVFLLHSPKGLLSEQ